MFLPLTVNNSSEAPPHQFSHKIIGPETSFFFHISRNLQHPLSPFTTTMSRRITALNNTGIKSLCNGFYSEAIYSFRMALECLKPSAGSVGESEDPVACSQLLVPLQPLPLFCLQDANLMEVSPHNTFEVYQYAFAFPKTLSVTAFRSELSVILLFNLGLAHQLAGFSSANLSQEHLQQALKYYKLSLSVFRSQTSIKFDSGCFNIVLGTLTNMGNLFNHFWSPKEAEACRKHIHEILSSAAILDLSDEASEFFLSALTYSAAHDAVAAPAA